MPVTLIDSPLANIGNVVRALRNVGVEPHLTKDAAAIANADCLVLPGVGTFPAAMSWLEETGISDALRHAVTGGAHLLGICVGHQLLFESSEELRPTRGLSLCEGNVQKFDAGLPVPQIGWNEVELDDDPLFEGLPSREHFYFVNSFYAEGVPAANSIGSSVYGTRFNAVVRTGRVYGLQFHPEKSSSAGLRLLSNFVRNTQ